MLTIEERAYRRGALQAIEFLIGFIQNPMENPSFWDGGEGTIRCLAAFQQELLKGRNSPDVRYQGTYLDVIRQLVGLRLRQGTAHLDQTVSRTANTTGTHDHRNPTPHPER